MPLADNLQTLVSVAPKIKTPIQLAGFAFSIFAFFLIHRVNPDNIASLSVVGAIGVALIAIPLAFHANVLRHVPDTHRVGFMLGLMAMLLVSFGALGYVTYSSVTSLPPKGARFDSRLEAQRIVVIPRPNKAARIELTWQLFPLSRKEGQGATVFLGLVTLHDERKISEAGLGKKTNASCKSVPSCLGSHVFRELVQSPILVREDTPGSPLTAVVDVSRVPQHLRVWWEFYQLEGPNGQTCGIDHKRDAPVEGLPPLAMFNNDDKRVGDSCYRSFGQRTLPVSTN